MNEASKIRKLEQKVRDLQQQIQSQAQELEDSKAMCTRLQHEIATLRGIKNEPKTDDEDVHMMVQQRETSSSNSRKRKNDLDHPLPRAKTRAPPDVVLPPLGTRFKRPTPKREETLSDDDIKIISSLPPPPTLRSRTSSGHQPSPRLSRTAKEEEGDNKQDTKAALFASPPTSPSRRSRSRPQSRAPLRLAKEDDDSDDKDDKKAVRARSSRPRRTPGQSARVGPPQRRHSSRVQKGKKEESVDEDDMDLDPAPAPSPSTRTRRPRRLDLSPPIAAKLDHDSDEYRDDSGWAETKTDSDEQEPKRESSASSGDDDSDQTTHPNPDSILTSHRVLTRHIPDGARALGMGASFTRQAISNVFRGSTQRAIVDFTKPNDIAQQLGVRLLAFYGSDLHIHCPADPGTDGILFTDPLNPEYREHDRWVKIIGDVIEEGIPKNEFELFVKFTKEKRRVYEGEGSKTLDRALWRYMGTVKFIPQTPMTREEWGALDESTQRKYIKMIRKHRLGHPLNKRAQTFEEVWEGFDEGVRTVPRLRVEFLGVREGLQDALLAPGDGEA